MKKMKSVFVGENARFSKLKTPEVIEIRYRFKSLRASISFLSREYDVSPKTIRDIVTRHTWKHV